MNKQKSLRTLEFDRVLALLADKAVTDGAKEAAIALLPFEDIDEALMAQRHTSDAKDLMTTHGSPPLAPLKDPTAAIKRTDMGGSLNPRELLAIASLLQCARRVSQYGSEEEGGRSSLAPMFRRIAANKYLEDKINNCFISEEEVADGASSELATIRRKMRLLNGRIREILNKFIGSSSSSKYLQENIITMRSDRFVVPVKSEHRGDVPGMVHDVSSSGATIFVEPAQVVTANNDLKLEQAREKQEIERILAELSAEVSDFGEGICDDYASICALDLVFAKAKLSFQMNGDRPNINTEGHTRLLRARHPLLDPKTAVPIDIAIGGDYDTLVVTGPNTGGKTVSLKTIGLLTLMSCAGLHIPAGDESTVAFTEHIYADIGDEQSIEQSLSTFSAHMKNITEILAVCGKGDLVLFDELGAGTDPIEGAALAIAILEYTRMLGAKVCATTHYSEIKMYALTTEGVENASCEFNVETLRPTYKILTGIPGKSNAFAISARLGLPEHIINRAKEQISTENARFEDVIASLEKERQAVERKYAETEQLKRVAQSERDKISSISKQTESEQEKIIRLAREKAEDILRDARMAADTVFDQISALKKESSKSQREQNLAAARLAAKTVLRDAEGKVSRKEKKTMAVVEEVKAGDDVELINIGARGTVLAVSGENVTVQAGIIKMNVKRNELRRLVQNQKQAQGQQHRVTELSTRQASTELDIRGMNIEEGILEIDGFLSDCLMANLSEVSIIHGKGTGVLRSGVHQHLRGNRAVKSFRLGKYGEGEQGVTIIELR